MRAGPKLACMAVISSVPYSSASLVACQMRDSRDLKEPDASLQGYKSRGRDGRRYETAGECPHTHQAERDGRWKNTTRLLLEGNRAATRRATSTAHVTLAMVNIVRNIIVLSAWCWH